jgi:ABC-2 type transport system permease protein
MRGLFTIYRRELAGLFLSPLAWILFCLTLFYNAFFFLHYLQFLSLGEVNYALSLLSGGALPFWYLLLILPPLLTMRMISEESRSGLLEFLLTSPAADAAVITGKALAATSFLALVWSCAPIFGVVLQLLGATPDWGVVFTAWLGSTLVSGLLVAIGLVCSALSSTPLIAAFLATVANIVVVFLPTLAGNLRGAPGELVAAVVSRVDVMAHLQGSFMTGALDSAHVVFFLAWIGALLFLAVRIVESRRWR